MVHVHCNGHEPYFTYADAERALAGVIAYAKRTGHGGKSYKRLNIWPCGDHWHVGRSCKNPNSIVKKHKQEKLITFGEARRKLAALDRAMDRHTDYMNRRRAEFLGKIIEAERQAGLID